MYPRWSPQVKNKLLFKLYCSLLLTLGLITNLYAQNNFVYLNLGGSDINGFVAGFSVGANGALVSVPGSPFSTGVGSGGFGNGIIASSLRGTMYVSGDRGSRISALSITPATGVLTPVAGSPFDSATGMLGGLTLAITPDERFLFARNSQTGELATFRIGADSGLIRLSTLVSTFSGKAEGSGMKVSPDGKFLILGEGSSGISVAVFSIASDGTLARVFGTSFTPSSDCDGRALELNCAGNLLFVASDCGDIFTFNIAANGTLTLTDSPFGPLGAGIEHILLTSAGNLMFVSDIHRARILALGVGPTGSISPVPLSTIDLSNPSDEDTRPVDLALNREETRLYVNSADGTIFEFNIAPGGLVTPVIGSPFHAFGGYGVSIAAFPPKTCGPVFDLCIQDDSNTNIFRINSTTGEYQFANCGGVIAQGTATVTKKGCLISLQQNANDKRLLVRVDSCQNKATASLQVLSQGATLTIIDRNTLDDPCVCR